MQKKTVSSVTIQRIAVSQIHRVPTARPLDESHVQDLVSSIQQFGLLQAIAVSPDGDCFSLVAGNHRFAAVLYLGHETIDAVVLPDDITNADELALSLHENHIRKDEAVEDLLGRIQALATYDESSLSDAAKKAGVSSATLSKIQKIVNALSPAALAFIRKRKIGNAIAYEVARLAHDDDQQMAWLEAHANGHMSREDIRGAAAATSVPAVKKLQISLTLDKIGIKLSVPKTLGYDALLGAITSVRAQIVKQQKREIGFDLLPKVLR